MKMMFAFLFMESAAETDLCFLSSLHWRAHYGLFITPWIHCLQAGHRILREKVLQEIICLPFFTFKLLTSTQFNKELQAPRSFNK